MDSETSAIISFTCWEAPRISSMASSGAAGGLHARGDVLDALLDQGLDFLCRRGASIRKLAHLVSHHGEPPPVLAGPGRLDGGVQRQEVGLVGDVGDHVHDPADLFRACGNGVDAGNHRTEQPGLPATALSTDLRARAEMSSRLLETTSIVSSACAMELVPCSAAAAWDLSVLRNLVHRRRQLLNRCAGLLQAWRPGSARLRKASARCRRSARWMRPAAPRFPGWSRPFPKASSTCC